MKLDDLMEQATSAARDELYDTYMRKQEEARGFIADLVNGSEAAKLTVQWLLRYWAAHELRCESAGVPVTGRSPLPLLLDRELIDKTKAVIRQEICHT